METLEGQTRTSEVVRHEYGERGPINSGDGGACHFATMLSSSQSNSFSDVLAHYDPRVPIRLAGNASSYGIGAVLSYVFADGPNDLLLMPLGPCYQMSKTMHRKALSLIFGEQKFHQYIYSLEFNLVTDHRPLTSRSHIWWPGLDQEVEEMIKACTACQEVNTLPQVPHYIHGSCQTLHGLEALCSSRKQLYFQ